MAKGNPMASGPDTASVTKVSDEILDAVNIPTLPEAAVKLLTICRDPFVGAAEIVRVVELDTALSARVLKIANSAAFGLKRRINTLTSAAVVLGNENLKVVALGFHLCKGWDSLGGEGFDVREFWRDSVVRACLARRLAQSVGYQPREEMFLLGMLQDIGTLIMGTHLGSAYRDVSSGFGDDANARCSIERSQFGTDHVMVASRLAERWDFPPNLAGAMTKQCVEPPCVRSTDPAELLWQVGYFCAMVPFSRDRQTAQVCGRLRNLSYGAFELSFEGLSDVFTDAVEQFNALRNVFSRVLGVECDVENMMAEAREFIEASDTELSGEELPGN
jgi:HD-like signal output (HDOD) protein